MVPSLGAGTDGEAPAIDELSSMPFPKMEREWKWKSDLFEIVSDLINEIWPRARQLGLAENPVRSVRLCCGRSRVTKIFLHLIRQLLGSGEKLVC